MPEPFQLLFLIHVQHIRGIKPKISVQQSPSQSRSVRRQDRQQDIMDLTGFFGRKHFGIVNGHSRDIYPGQHRFHFFSLFVGPDDHTYVGRSHPPVTRLSFRHPVLFVRKDLYYPPANKILDFFLVPA